MKKFPMLVFAFGLPLLGFMVLKDGSGTLYKSEGSGLSYQIIEPEDPVIEEEVEETAAVDEVAVVEDRVVENPAPEVTATEDAVVEDQPVVEAETPATEDVALVAALSEEEMIVGKKAARACVACHQLERERNAVGPHLVGIIGRTIGGVDGFRYSDALTALAEEGQVWTEASLEKWLIDPSAFAQGTKMNFKVRDEEKRRLIAGYLAGQ
jgi:cytochrome c